MLQFAGSEHRHCAVRLYALSRFKLSCNSNAALGWKIKPDLSKALLGNSADPKISALGL